MAKRIQQDSGEERVTAKSRPMMSLIARAPSNVSSSTSVSPGTRSYGSQNPWSTIAEKEEGSGRPDICIDRKKAFDHYYHEQFMESFSSQATQSGMMTMLGILKSGKLILRCTSDRGDPMKLLGERHEKANLVSLTRKLIMMEPRNSVVNEVTPHDRSWRPDVDSQEEAWPQQFVIGHDEAELELSVESRSLVNRVNDQVRKKTETNFKCYRRWRETFHDLGNVHDCNNGISSIHGKELPEQLSIHCEHNRSHTQTNVRHIYKIGVWTENHSWCHWLVTKELSIFKARRSTFFRILCCALVRFSKTHQSNDAWEQRLGWLKFSSEYRNFDRIDGEPTEFEWNIFPGFNTFQLGEEVKRLLLRLDETPENFTGRIIFMSMSNDISCGSKDNEKECLANAKLVSLYAKRIWKRTLVIYWSWFWKRSGTVSAKTVHKEYGTILLKGCWWNSQKADVQFSALRAHCPEVDSEAKDTENCRYTMQPIWKRLRLFFA